ncbi:hypothetical protein F8S09_07355 [Deinococcus sp. SDU3-2]|uniref:Uncharacterized protein n=1 Tax=Deinococcus terrestris TaxID=2651870 RepID=A0A7X1NVE7_9DEIO|nr:hypothetical protein [Deinococcus terrestris]MPY66512.1 hypothetical protein [Deinococcus terrestris]
MLNPPHPFCAPIAAVIGLNASLGTRGTNARRRLGVGELAVLGSGDLAFAVATLVAVSAAQAASSAVPTVTVAGGEAGLGRLTDALIGVAVAPTFSQGLFLPEPLGLLRRAQRAALLDLAVVPRPPAT